MKVKIKKTCYHNGMFLEEGSVADIDIKGIEDKAEILEFDKTTAEEKKAETPVKTTKKGGKK